MKIQQLQNLVTVIDCDSINKATKKLYMTQPNISQSTCFSGIWHYLFSLFND